MPMLFHCHECDKPTGNKDMICDNCIEKTKVKKHKEDKEKK
jgi:hypothetical protein